MVGAAGGPRQRYLWFGKTRTDRRYEACIPPKSKGKIQIRRAKALIRKRHKIENMCGKLKDLRRLYTRYELRGYTLKTAIGNIVIC